MDIRLEDILDLGDYERSRDSLRPRAMAARALRRVDVGPHASMAFENRTTLLYQVQEMLRTERIVRPAEIAHEVETYRELLPRPFELSATLLFEFTDAATRPARLAELIGIERHLELAVGPLAIAARFDARQIDAERVSAVQFVRFALGVEGLAEMRRGLPVGVRITHPRYRHETLLAPATVDALVADLEEAAR